MQEFVTVEQSLMCIGSGRFEAVGVKTYQAYSYEPAEQMSVRKAQQQQQQRSEKTRK
jgi:hypothetical protein